MTISAINLGNSFTNASGTSVLSGVSSGINTQAIITSLVAAQSAQVTKLQDKVTVNNTQATALTSLQQLLTQFQTAANQLSNPQSPDPSTNVFANATATVTSNTSQAASNYFTATAAANTLPGSYTISNISHIATASTQLSSTTFSSATSIAIAGTATAGMFTAGTYTITGPAGSGTVTLNNGGTLNDVATAFNDISTNTGIKAAVLQTAPGVYKIAFSSTTTGANTTFDFANGGATPTVSDGSGTPLSLGISFDATSTGANAQFQLNGVTITRTSNTFSDLIPGITFNLLQDTTTQAGASFTLQVTPDASSITTAVVNFATAYNNFLNFYAQQTAVGTDGTPTSAATLYTDSTLRTIYNQITSQTTSIVTGLSSGSVNKLTDVGLSFGSSAATSTTPAISNVLYLDTTALTSAIQNNLAGVENIFGYNLRSSSPNLASFQPATDKSITSFTLNVAQSTPPATYVATYTDKNGALQTVNLTASAIGSGGVSLTAPSTSGLAGLVLIYTGTGDESNIAVTTTYGVAAQVNNFMTSALSANTGLLATDQSGIAKNTTSLQTQITTVNTQITAQRQQLLQKFSVLEAAISKANSSLNLLNAQQLAGSGG